MYTNLWTGPGCRRLSDHVTHTTLSTAFFPSSNFYDFSFFLPHLMSKNLIQWRSPFYSRSLVLNIWDTILNINEQKVVAVLFMAESMLHGNNSIVRFISLLLPALQFLFRSLVTNRERFGILFHFHGDLHELLMAIIPKV